MKALDRFLQRWRMAKAVPHIQPGDSVLDVGCADAALFKVLGSRIRSGVGIDEDGCNEVQGSYRLMRGRFPDDLPPTETFDVITVLAVLEHIPVDAQETFARSCFERVQPGGRVVVTVPQPSVDRIIDVLKALHLLDGMAEHQHYGFDTRRTSAIFEAAGFRTIVSRRFQLRLNNLFVFYRPRELTPKVELSVDPTAQPVLMP
jgi:2-polyprenyl-3-methyl-5-hydroxy-6-metoxy-1,4-benzoquinol methylase